MIHKSKYFESLNQQDFTDSQFLSTECRIQTIEKLEVFKQNPRLLIRLRMILETDNIYEAHQLYKTIHFRCSTLNLLADCIELLYNGVVYFASKNAVRNPIKNLKILGLFFKLNIFFQLSSIVLSICQKFSWKL
jgi:hypothetical protein